MIRKYILKPLINEDLDMQERMFTLLSTIGLIGLFIMMVIHLIRDDDYSVLFLLVLSWVFILAVSNISIRTHHIQAGGMILGLFIVLVMYPFIFFIDGGLYGGAPIWFLFASVYCAMALRGKSRFVMLVLSVIMASVVYGIGYMYPELINSQSRSAAYADSLMSAVVVSLVFAALILFQNYIYEVENERANQQKREIEELNESQNRFFSSMSHEIRTPINTIIGLNEMILREDISSEVAEDAKNIQGASKMLLTIINDILDMSKIESGRMDIVPVSYDLGEMLSEIVNMVWIRAREKGLDFHVEVDSKLPSQLYGDEVRIKQVLINILNNAIKYTDEGSVTLSIQGKPAGHNVVELTYSVEDTGIGIKKENIPYLFDAFKRVDEQKNRYIEGTGLGLSIVKQIVELMHGEITVNSIYTRGSTFIVTLKQETVGNDTIGKLDFEARHAMNAFEHYKQSFEAPNANILVVDDTESNIMVVKKLLRDTRIRIDTAGDGIEAVSMCLNMQYDAILMDHLMPNMDGIEALHEIREQLGGMNHSTPIIALTANAGSSNQKMYRKEGFDGYLLKPVDGVTLESALIKVLPAEKVNIVGETEIATEGKADVRMHRKRRSVKIGADSVCDLPHDIIRQMHIAVLPCHIRTEEGVFLDGIETETDGILEYLKDETKVAYSEAPSVSEYEEFFAQQLTEAQYIIHICIAKRTSFAYDNAMEAASTFDNVLVIDSGHMSTGMGMLVMEAARLAESDVPPHEIVGRIEALKKKTQTSFVMSSTDLLARAGRMRKRDHRVSQALMMHPVVRFKDSDMYVSRIYAGNLEYVRRRYIRSCLKHPDSIDTKRVFITYAGVSHRELEEMEKEVRKYVDFEEVIYQKASPAISTNCGAGTIGIMYMRKG